jgi:hypothetical protein
MKQYSAKHLAVGFAALALSACTTGSATRTSGVIYQPTNAAAVQILFEKPTRPYDIIGQVGSRAANLASDDAIYRAMQKEAAEIGASAILVQGAGIEQETPWGYQGGYQRSRALALRWKDAGGGSAYSVTPTSVKPTTPRATQIIPAGVGQ